MLDVFELVNFMSVLASTSEAKQLGAQRIVEMTASSTVPNL